jgi:hypothetical protein
MGLRVAFAPLACGVLPDHTERKNAVSVLLQPRNSDHVGTLSGNLSRVFW